MVGCKLRKEKRMWKTYNKVNYIISKKIILKKTNNKYANLNKMLHNITAILLKVALDTIEK